MVAYGFVIVQQMAAFIHKLVKTLGWEGQPRMNAVVLNSYKHYQDSGPGEMCKIMCIVLYSQALRNNSILNYIV